MFHLTNFILQDEMSTKADNLMSRSKKSGVPKNKYKRKFDDLENSDEYEEKPQVKVVKTTKKKKEEEEYEEDSDDEESQLEVLHGTEAMSILSSSAAQSSSSKYAGRKNRGKLPQRFRE